MIAFCVFTHLYLGYFTQAAVDPRIGVPQVTSQISGFRSQRLQLAEYDEAPLIFDIPISYNKHVQKWVRYFQGAGRKWFSLWLERSHDVLPQIQRVLKREGLPQDLAYMAMIESGFSSHATSTAFAVGPWQFMRPTAERFGLKVHYWLDERKDLDKSTKAASKYLLKLYSIFGSWYLVAAGYNTGETRVVNIIKKYQTKNFWELVKQGAFVDETENYIPKLIAAALISKAPNLYGFRNLRYREPPQFDTFLVPSGTHLEDIANALNVTHEHMKELNPELILGYVPENVSGHRIRIPKGATSRMSKYMRQHFAQN